MAREKEIFRDCYNMLTDNLENIKWVGIPMAAQTMIYHKYHEDKDDQLLCAELIGVVVNHLDRKRGKDAK